MIFNLNNKKILITGASSGIGRATSILFSALGAELYLTARNKEELNRTAGTCKGKVEIFTSDLTKDDQIKNLIDSIGEISGWVHCAGKVLPVPVKFIQEKHLNEVFEINFHSAVKLTSALLRSNKLKNSSSVVFISSVSVLHSYFGGAPYISSKSALEGYAKTMALELSTRKIRVNVLQPALVKTEIFKQTIEAAQSQKDLNDYENSYPLGFGEPEDVAWASAYLISNMSKWVTGTFIKMDGGLSLGQLNK
ncbi:MAG: SDR family NAD(P)-dependent oxidoreductase [Bacteroidota bacterium]|jgi:NAD(P)-dependent dehydrogenase (short-subunit alcohol dehydrogenase family)